MLKKTYILSKFSKKPKGTAKGKIYIASDTHGLSTWQEYHIDGNVDDAIKMINKIQKLHKNDVNSRKKIT